MRKFILATDGSEGALRALGFAVALAAAFDAELELVTVTAGMGLSPDELRDFSRTESVSLAEVLDAQAQQVLERTKSRALQLGVRRVRTEAATGDPAETILEIAARDGADAIIVGKRGWGPLRSMLLGSVSQKLASLARCPVIVVP
jgi:nucleotide-binding universal stress UspA family protein